MVLPLLYAKSQSVFICIAQPYGAASTGSNSAAIYALAAIDEPDDDNDEFICPI
jgi:hypothetical protein